MNEHKVTDFELMPEEEFQRTWSEAKTLYHPPEVYVIEWEGDATVEEMLAWHQSALRGHGYFHIIEDVTL